MKSVRTWLCAGLIVLAGLAVYANSFRGPLVFDDLPAIRDNPSIRQLWPLTGVLLPARYPALEGNTVEGRPLLNLTFALNYAASGLAVWSYHAVNLAIHLLAGLTLFGVVRRTLLLPAYRERLGNSAEWLALAVALVWLVHPLQTESVTYLAQRAESLVGLLYLLAVYLAIRAFESSRPRVWSAGSVLACYCGVAAKESMVTAPVLVLLYDAMFVAGSLRKAWRVRRGYYLALFSSWVAFLVLVAGTGGSSWGNLMALVPGAVAAKTGHEIHWWDYALTQFSAILLYLRLSLWPARLTLDYGTEVARGFWEVAPPASLVVLLLAATAVALCRKHWAGYLGAWCFLILAPTTSVVPLSGQTMAEHRMYLPLAGLVVLFVMGGYIGWRRLAWKGPGWLLPASIAVAMFAALAGRTVVRNRDYRSGEAIWLDVIANRPSNFRAYNNYGRLLFDMGRLEEAVSYYEKTLERAPTYATAHGNLGNALLKLGRMEEGFAHCRRAVELQPDSPFLTYNLGVALQDAGRMEEAADQYRQVVRLLPDYAPGYNNLGVSLFKLGKVNEAILHYRKALEHQPEDAATHHNLANALAKAGRPAEALAHYRTAIGKQPDFAESYNNLGLVLLREGRRDEALGAFAKAVEIAPAGGARGRAQSGVVTRHFARCRRAQWPGGAGRGAAGQ